MDNDGSTCVNAANSAVQLLQSEGEENIEVETHGGQFEMASR